MAYTIWASTPTQVSQFCTSKDSTYTERQYTRVYKLRKGRLFHSCSNYSLPSMAHCFPAHYFCSPLCIFGSYVSAKVSKQNLKALFLLNQTSATDSFHLPSPPPPFNVQLPTTLDFMALKSALERNATWTPVDN